MAKPVGKQAKPVSDLPPQAQERMNNRRQKAIDRGVPEEIASEIWSADKSPQQQVKDFIQWLRR